MAKDYGSEFFLSRDLSWLDFNARVLDEAACKNTELLERLKFIAIFSSNLDEFFMVRIARLRRAVKQGLIDPDPAGLSAEQQLKLLCEKLTKLLDRQYDLLYNDLLPTLAEKNLRIAMISELSSEERNELKKYFIREVLPVLTPLAVAHHHPFPVLNNCVIELAVHLRVNDLPQRELFAFVEVPEVLERFIEIPGRSGQTFILLEDLIESELPRLFPNCSILGSAAFRITRDMDFTICDDGDDLMRTVELNLLERRSREPIRLEAVHHAPESLQQWLSREFDLDKHFRYSVKGMLNLKDLLDFISRCRRPELLPQPWPPVSHPELPENENIFQSISRHGEILLALPFQKFDPVIKMLETAVDDPSVLAIKQTLYRVSGDSPVVALLARAAAKGKQVTVIVELKARFDEGNNIVWARQLEAAGAHVVYGMSGLKTHAKALLVVRRESSGIKSYLHLATGNYNDRTARQYTDLSIFSDDPCLGSEISSLFNIITGCSRPEINWQLISAAPFDLRWRLLQLIDRETGHALSGRKGHIIAKMNSLSDPEVIRHLCAAADAGVCVQLIVRGICCMKPAAGSGNIQIISIVDHYLEHSRIFYFANDGNEDFYLSSADFMTRNLDRRIEIMFPVRRSVNRCKLKQILSCALQDRCKGRILQADGLYHLKKNGDRTSRSQQKLYELFAAETRNGDENIFKNHSGDPAPEKK